MAINKTEYNAELYEAANVAWLKNQGCIPYSISETDQEKIRSFARVMFFSGVEWYQRVRIEQLEKDIKDIKDNKNKEGTN
jgi:hypothetical protein